MLPVPVVLSLGGEGQRLLEEEMKSVERELVHDGSKLDLALQQLGEKKEERHQGVWMCEVCMWGGGRDTSVWVCEVCGCV